MVGEDLFPQLSSLWVKPVRVGLALNVKLFFAPIINYIINLYTLLLASAREGSAALEHRKCKLELNQYICSLKIRLSSAVEEGMEYLHSYAEQSKETCGWCEAVRLKFHTQFVFPVTTGAVKPRRDVHFL